jgi:hypothetical protein
MGRSRNVFGPRTREAAHKAESFSKWAATPAGKACRAVTAAKRRSGVAEQWTPAYKKYREVQLTRLKELSAAAREASRITVCECGTTFDRGVGGYRRAKRLTQPRCKLCQVRRRAIYSSVIGHWRNIFVTSLPTFKGKAKYHTPAYFGMPWHDGWNKDKEGLLAARDWIIATLGFRPEGGKYKYQLHVIDRAIGFVPGNLVWVSKDKHRQQEMINVLLFKVREFEAFADERDNEYISSDDSWRE